MYALTLKDPWGSLIAWGEKRIETRSWRPPARVLGQRIALHISAGELAPAERDLCRTPAFMPVLARHGVRYAERDPARPRRSIWALKGLLPAGHIVATCTVAAVERMDGPWIPAGLHAISRRTWPDWEPAQERAFGLYADGRFAWLLTEMHVLATPVPAKGHLGLWPVDPALEPLGD